MVDQAMAAFATQLMTNGIGHLSVEATSRVGGDHPTLGRGRKCYYRALAHRECGVLLAHVGDDGALDVLADRLRQEAANYELMREAGHEVPKALPEPFAIQDHLTGGRVAAALVVEHIGGLRPFNGIYPRSLMGVANEMVEPARSAAKAAWARLQLAIGRISPVNLQLMLEPTGRIVVIDCKATTTQPIYCLQNWNDAARTRRPGDGQSQW